jgi:hypothetical protein
MKVAWDVTFDKLDCWALCVCVEIFLLINLTKSTQISERKLVFKSVAFLVDKDVWGKDLEKCELSAFFLISCVFSNQKTTFERGDKCESWEKLDKTFKDLFLVSRIKQTNPKLIWCCGIWLIGKTNKKMLRLVNYSTHTQHNTFVWVSGWGE